MHSPTPTVRSHVMSSQVKCRDPTWQKLLTRFQLWLELTSYSNVNNANIPSSSDGTSNLLVTKLSLVDRSSLISSTREEDLDGVHTTRDDCIVLQRLTCNHHGMLNSRYLPLHLVIFGSPVRSTKQTGRIRTAAAAGNGSVQLVRRAGTGRGVSPGWQFERGNQSQSTECLVGRWRHSCCSMSNVCLLYTSPSPRD